MNGSVYGELPVPVREGYSFVGWYTSDDKLVTSETIVVANKDETVYAKWIQNEYSIKYDTDGGSNDPDDQVKEHGTSIQLSTTIPIKFGYAFMGWSDGISTYMPGDMFAENRDVTLYAVWELAPDLILPTSLTSIEEEAFSGGVFTYAVLPDGVSNISSKAFADCPNLKHIEIPADEITIAKDAFSGVTGLTIHCHADSDAYWYAQRYGYDVELME